jgi:hypothetical protein
LKCLGPDNSPANFVSRLFGVFPEAYVTGAIVAMQHEDVTKVGDGRFNRVMIAADYLKRRKSYRVNE